MNYTTHLGTAVGVEIDAGKAARGATSPAGAMEYGKGFLFAGHGGAG